MLTKGLRNGDVDRWLAQLDRPLNDLEKLRRAGETRVPAEWTAALARLGIDVPASAEPQQVVTAIWATATAVATAERPHTGLPTHGKHGTRQPA